MPSTDQYAQKAHSSTNMQLAERLRIIVANPTLFNHRENLAWMLEAATRLANTQETLL